MDEIVALLGHPVETLQNIPEHPYCFYGKLSVQYNLENSADSHVEWLQINHADDFRKGPCRLANGLFLDFPGLNGLSRPSEFIRTVKDIERVKVRLVDAAFYPGLALFIGEEIQFYFHEFGEDRMETPPTLVDHVRRLDVEVRLVEFGSYDCREPHHHHNIRQLSGPFEPFTVTGREYLNAIDR